MLTPVTDPLLAQSGVNHGFFTKAGGVSFDRDELNCGPKSKDDPNHIAENRRRVGAFLGGTLEGVSQFHSADVVTLAHSLEDQRPDADGLVTDRPGLCLSVLTADCGPILFADTHAGVIGAAHSGWKGTVGNIARNTVDAMVKLGAKPENICAVVGPTIAQQSYEVAPDFPDKLAGLVDEPMQFMVPSDNPGRHMFDLPALIGHQLKGLVGHSHVLDRDTYALEQDFYSFRRATHRNEPDYGRQISAICMSQA